MVQFTALVDRFYRKWMMAYYMQ